MTEHEEHESEYSDDLIARLELLWGDGFLSPGGAAEVAIVLEGVDVAGCHVLDIGCGLGVIDVLLVREHGAQSVIGVDVEQRFIDRAMTRATEAGLSDRISFQRVQPGPFPFSDQTFDIVFSKDSMIHIPDKPALYTEVLRILRPGGAFVASDWLQSEAAVSSATMREFCELIGLTFNLETPDNTHRALNKAGFVKVALRDRHAWYKDVVHRESTLIRGSLKSKALELLGAEAYEHWLEVRGKMDIVLDKGELRPTHLRARRLG
jgi:2-polyprenyl-3-methyl-5-hydroxy-6-metoxy-1,4-benzoquinol methylase